MSSAETDAALANARAARDRVREDRLAPVVQPSRRRIERAHSLGRRMTRIAVADAAILLAAVVIGFATPLGIFGALAVMILLLAVTVLFAVWPAQRVPVAEALRTTDIRVLPRQTERWLEAQRPALPAPAVTLADRIGARLATLEPQIAALAPDAPAVEDVRKLVGEQLPDFIRDYQRVPQALRTVERNGRTPDAQLVDGLKLIDRQIAEISENLAQGDLDTLATRGRYLEIKYQGEGTAG